MNLDPYVASYVIRVINLDYLLFVFRYLHVQSFHCLFVPLWLQNNRTEITLKPKITYEGNLNLRISEGEIAIGRKLSHVQEHMHAHVGKSVVVASRKLKQAPAHAPHLGLLDARKLLPNYQVNYQLPCQHLPCHQLPSLTPNTAIHMTTRNQLLEPVPPCNLAVPASVHMYHKSL